MPKHKATSKNVHRVLQTALDQCNRPGDEGRHYRKFWAYEMNQVCDNAGDAFGTEGQNDPRGDQRD